MLFYGIDGVSLVNSHYLPAVEEKNIIRCVALKDPPGRIKRNEQAPRIKKFVPKSEEQLKDIETAISRCFLFSSLDEDQRKEVGVVSLLH